MDKPNHEQICSTLELAEVAVLGHYQHHPVLKWLSQTKIVLSSLLTSWAILAAFWKFQTEEQFGLRAASFHYLCLIYWLPLKLSTKAMALSTLQGSWACSGLESSMFTFCEWYWLFLTVLWPFLAWVFSESSGKFLDFQMWCLLHFQCTNTEKWYTTLPLSAWLRLSVLYPNACPLNFTIFLNRFYVNLLSHFSLWRAFEENLSVFSLCD